MQEPETTDHVAGFIEALLQRIRDSPRYAECRSFLQRLLSDKAETVPSRTCGLAVIQERLKAWQARRDIRALLPAEDSNARRAFTRSLKTRGARLVRVDRAERETRQ